MSDFFESNLPWYVNGTIDKNNRAKMDKYIRSNPLAALRLQEYRDFDEKVKLMLKPGSYDEAPGLTNVLSKIRKDKTSSKNISWWKKGIPFIQFPLVNVIVLMLLVGQSLVIGFLLINIQSPLAEYGKYRSFQNSNEIGPFIEINFVPSTREFDIRMLLISVGAVNIGGPTQLGDYYLHVPTDHLDVALKKLKASEYVMSVKVVSIVPPL